MIFSQTGYEKYHDFGIWFKNADNFKASKVIPMKYSGSDRAGIDLSENVYVH